MMLMKNCFDIITAKCGTCEYPSNRKHSEVRQLWSSCHEFEVCPEKGTALQLRLDKSKSREWIHVCTYIYG